MVTGNVLSSMRRYFLGVSIVAAFNAVVVGSPLGAWRAAAADDRRRHAFGATLDLNPLAVLIVTIAAGSLFGMVGLVLGAPLASAAVHISRDLAAAKSATEPEPPPPETAPIPSPTGV